MQAKWIDFKFGGEADKFNKSQAKLIYPSAENIYFKLVSVYEPSYEPFPKNPIYITKIEPIVKIGPSKDRPKRVFV
jgi:hypothetical protein